MMLGSTLVVTIFFRLAVGVPTFVKIVNYTSHSCSKNFVVHGQDYILLGYKVSGSDKDYTYANFYSPRYLTTEESSILCGLADAIKHTCTGYYRPPTACFCEKTGPDEHIFSLNLTMYKKYDRDEIYLKWPDQGAGYAITSELYPTGDVKEACNPPNATLLTMVSTNRCDNNDTSFLLDGNDTTEITFEISGSRHGHELGPVVGPRLYYTSARGEEREPCPLLEVGASCKEMMEPIDDCRCVKMAVDVYRLTFNKTANIDDSLGTVYIKWPGTTDEIVFDKLSLPEVRDSCQVFPRTTTETYATTPGPNVVAIALVVGVLILAIIFAVAGGMYYNKYGMRARSEENNRAVGEHTLPEAQQTIEQSPTGKTKTATSVGSNLTAHLSTSDTRPDSEPVLGKPLVESGV